MFRVTHTLCRVTLKWAINAINKLRLRPALLMTPRISLPAHRRLRGPPGRIDTNSDQRWRLNRRLLDRSTNAASPTPPVSDAFVRDDPIGISSGSLASEN